MRPAVPVADIADETAAASGAAERSAAHSTRLTLLLWALALTVTWVSLSELYDPTFIAVDGAFYVDAAKNLVEGHGFATTIVWNDEHYHVGGMPARQTVFPPGYPLLIALVSRLGVDLHFAAFLVALLSFVAIPLVVFDILKTAGYPFLRSFAVSAVWLVMPFAWFNVLGCMSEIPFTLLTLACLRLIMQGERDLERQHLWLAAAGTVAGLAFTVRYQGVYFVGSLGLFFLLRMIRQRDWPSVRALLLVTGPASVFVLALFFRNHLLIGKLAALMPGDRSLLEVLQTVWWAVGELSGFTKAGLMRGGVAELTLVLVVATGVAGAGRLRIDRSALRAVAESQVSLSLIYAAVSVALMTHWARGYASGHISPRYLLPLIPFGLLCLPHALQLFRVKPGRPWHPRAAWLWCGAAVLTLVAGQINAFQIQWHALTRANSYRAMEHALQRPIGNQTLQQFLSGRITPASPLLGNEAQLLGAVLDRPVLGLPWAPFTQEQWTNERVYRLVATYGVTYVAFFPRLFSTVEHDRERTFFYRIGLGDVPRWLVPVLDTPDVRLYRVEPARERAAERARVGTPPPPVSRKRR